MRRHLTITFLFILLNILLPSTANAEKSEQLKNLERGAHNLVWGWTEFMERTHQEAAKGTNTGERIVGVIAGSAVGVRKSIHRLGAGAIDLLTFWIPKKEPLIKPEDPPVQ